MDLIQSFLPYAGMNPQKLNRYIESHPGLLIARKYKSLTSELAEMRLQILGTCGLNGKGALKVEDVPGHETMQARISSLEASIGRLTAIAREYASLLESCGVTDPTAPQEDLAKRLEELSITSEIGPSCWQAFILEHNRSPLTLPGDILKGDYAAFEKEKMAQREKALADIAPLKVAMHRMQALGAEAASL